LIATFKSLRRKIRNPVIEHQSVGFLFTDIEGSTRITKQLGDAYVSVLDKHNRIVRDAISMNAGEEVDNAGDGFFVIFQDPVDAVAAAIQIQQELATSNWPPGGRVRVRIGLHYGDVSKGKEGYTGLEIHRASRIGESAHGGQVTLSEAMEAILRDQNLPGKVTIRQLGKFKLKEFEGNEALFQLVIPGMRNEYPLLRAEPSFPVVAVLPLECLNDDPQLGDFGYGISEDVIIHLEKTRGIRVVARSLSFGMREQNLDTQEIGKRLKVSAVLDGTLRRIESRLRLTLELVDVQTGYNLWTGKYEGEMTDLFRIEDEIAQQIIKALEIKLTKDIQGSQISQTNDIRAYEYYLKGRRLYIRFTRDSVLQAKEMFEEAIKLDKQYALAYAGLADCYAYLYLYVENKGEILKKAEVASIKSIVLNPLLAKAYASRGYVLSLSEKFEESEVIFEKSIELNPLLFEAHYLYGRVEFIQGIPDKAARLFEEAHRLRPEDFQSLFLAGKCYTDLGDTARSDELRREGIRVAEEHLKFNPQDPRAWYLGANGLAVLDEKEKSLEWLSNSLELEPDDPMVLYNVGCTYALLNRAEEAIEFLERSFHSGVAHKKWYTNDSDLALLKNHPRFIALLEKMN